MESLLAPKPVTFAVLRARLVQQVKLRINNGEFTERGLSRILGISQSQTHNVLKGARPLQMRLADQILAKLGLSAMDLLNEDELQAASQLKMLEWDRQSPTGYQSGLPELLDNWLIPKKPAGRTPTKSEREDKQTG